MTGPVLVTGASGNLGGAVVRSLTAAGVPVRAARTSVVELQARYPAVPTTHLDFYDPRSFAPALDGASGLFLVRPPPISRVGPTLSALLDEAQRAGLGHVVFSSVAGADTSRIVPHHRVETHLARSTLSWTILRPGFFAQNIADAYRTEIVEQDRILLPAGRGRAAFIDIRDVGDVAAVIFADPPAHRGLGYLLTGPQSVDFDEVAALLTIELGRAIRYEPASVLTYLRHLHQQGLPLAQAVIQTVLHTGLRSGQAAVVDPTLPRLLGRAARPLGAYLHDVRSTWAIHPDKPTH